MSLLHFLPGSPEGWVFQLRNAGNAYLSIFAVRSALNIQNPLELDDDVILTAVRHAVIDAQARAGKDADVDLLRLAAFKLALYYAYTAYLSKNDRQPDTLLKSLREDAEKALDEAAETRTPKRPRFGTFSASGLGMY